MYSAGLQSTGMNHSSLFHGHRTSAPSLTAVSQPYNPFSLLSIYPYGHLAAFKNCSSDLPLPYQFAVVITYLMYSNLIFINICGNMVNSCFLLAEYGKAKIHITHLIKYHNFRGVAYGAAPPGCAYHGTVRATTQMPG